MLKLTTRISEEDMAVLLLGYRRRGIIEELLDARYEAEEKHGKNKFPAAVWLSLLGEEYGEVAKAVNELMFGHDDTPEEAQVKLVAFRKELMDVAQVAMAAIEQIDEEAAT